jgi:putative endonuclease
MPSAHTKKCFWIYILECENGSYYTGYTTNLARRYRQHVEGKAGVRYTRSHRPTRLAQCWRVFDTVGTALKVESLIKRRGRRAKNRLVEDPAALEPLASRALNRRILIYTADPGKVEGASMTMSSEDFKKGYDPFSGLPPKDL